MPSYISGTSCSNNLMRKLFEVRDSTIERPFSDKIHFGNQRADAIALAIALMRNLFFLGQNRLGAAEVDDHVLAFEALHDS